MSLNSHWFQKYKPSNLKIVRLSMEINDFVVFNFDGLYFWNHWELRDVMYLILKVLSVVIWSQQLKGIPAFMGCSSFFPVHLST